MADTEPTTLPAVRDQRLAMTLETPADEVLAHYDKMKFMISFLMDEKKKFENDFMLGWMDANGDLDMGNGKRLYPGTVKKTTCINVGRTLDALIDRAYGDFDRVVECLASQPIKHGAARTILGDEWDKHFTVKEQRDVKTGATKRQVKALDERFIKTHNQQERNNED